MRRFISLLLGLCLLLAACGGNAPDDDSAPGGAVEPTQAPTVGVSIVPPPAVVPTATPTPQRPTPTPTRPRPTPTATIAPTVAPTPTRVRLAAAATITEQTGRCKVGLPAGFAADGEAVDTWRSADRLVAATLVAPDTTGDPTLDAATETGIARVQKLVAEYKEATRTNGAGSRRVAFTGKIGDTASWGTLYIRQFGLDFCQFTITASAGTTMLLDPVIETMIGSLVATNPRPAPVGYLALGDSYAAGVGASDPAGGGYAALFASALRDANGQPVGLQNLAIPGVTSADFVGDWATSGREGKSALANAVRAMGAEGIRVVTIDIGGNDILRLLKPGQPCADKAIESDECLAAMREALKTTATPNLPLIFGALVEAARPGTQIIVLTYPNPFSVGQKSLTETRTDQAMNDLNTIITSAVRDLEIRAAARNVTLTLVDIAPLFTRQGARLTHILASPPDIHPTDAGHAVIAEALGRAYKK